MEVFDFSDTASTFHRRNSAYLLNDMRCIIVGKSGCGKTVLMFNMILRWLDFDDLYIYGKSVHQPLYLKLKQCYESGCSNEATVAALRAGVGEELIRDLATGQERKVVFLETLPPPEEFDKSRKNVIVFDDVMLESQSGIEPFFARGRHNNINCFYITQNYAQVPNRTIRENANFLIAFQQNDQSIRNIHANHATELDLRQFREICRAAWSAPRSFLVIVPDSAPKYRRNFDEAWSFRVRNRDFRFSS